MEPTTELTNRSQAKHWCITVNNYTDADVAQFVAQQPYIQYSVVGHETASTGTRHLQCYIAFKQKKTLSSLKKLWKDGHFEIMRGTPQQASDYCKKENEYVEYGELPVTAAKKGGDATKAKWETMLQHAKDGELEMIDAKQRYSFNF